MGDKVYKMEPITGKNTPKSVMISRIKLRDWYNWAEPYATKVFPVKKYSKKQWNYFSKNMATLKLRKYFLNSGNSIKQLLISITKLCMNWPRHNFMRKVISKSNKYVQKSWDRLSGVTIIMRHLWLFGELL